MTTDDRPLDRELVRGILRAIDHIADDDYLGDLECVVRLVPIPELFRTLSRMIGRRRVARDPALFFCISTGNSGSLRGRLSPHLT